MQKMGVLEGFSNMVKMLFKDAATAISLNGCETPTFEIVKEIRQGVCWLPISFYLLAKLCTP